MNLPPAPAQQDVLDALDSGLIVLDRDRRILQWNAWMSLTSGHSSVSVLGKRLGDVFAEADLTRLQVLIDSALATGVSGLLTHALHARLLPLKTRAGRELLHDVTVAAIQSGRTSNCLIHVSDVTMAVRRERYLRDRQKARYDAVVEHAPDVILTLDRDGIIRLVNRATLTQFGFTEAQLVGQSPSVLFEVPAVWASIWQRVRSGEKSGAPIELEVRRADGTTAFFEMSASRWLNESHAIVTAILRDVSERRAAARALADLNATLEQRVEERTRQLIEAEEALRQSHKMEAIGQLTGGIAHDFNNLLQGIIGAMNIIERRVAEGRISDIDRFVKGALKSAQRASALTHRLLAFSRRQPINPRPVNVGQLIGSIEELLRRSIGEGIRMNVEHAKDLWTVCCDANQFENALLNLAINARDAMPDGGMLTISTMNVSFDASQAAIRDIKPGDYVSTIVQDTGVGMPPDVQARAFDPFYTTKPIGKGTGLGLSMIYGFARQSEGSVRISSLVGRGTAVEISFPRYDGNSAAVREEEEELADPASGQNEVVLVVEDEEVVRLLIVEVLTDLGYRALEAADGPSALRILQSSQKIDLLVTDIGLPDINGRQVADAGHALRPNLKTLFMTGYAESAATGQLLERGMQLITKPFTMDELAAKIRAMIESNP